MCFESEHRYESGRHYDAPAAERNPVSAAPEWPVSRREFVKGAATVASAAAVGFPVYAPAETPSEKALRTLPLTITVNGDTKHLQIDPRTSLLDLLREDLQLTGTKKGCDHGQCGACTDPGQWNPH